MAAPLLASVVLLGCLVLLGCEVDPPVLVVPSGASSASPNASILPAPRARDTSSPDDVEVDPARGPLPALLEGGLRGPSGERLSVVASPLRPDRPLPPEPPARLEAQGLWLRAIVRMRDLPAPSGEVTPAVLAELREAARRQLELELTEAGRLRLVFASDALPLARDTELRARPESLGQVLVFPGRRKYRVVAPGALRPLLSEGRLDVSPLVTGTIARDAEVKLPRVDGLAEAGAAREVSIESPLGSVRLVLTRVPEAGLGGRVLCRLLLDLAAVETGSTVCFADELPVVAQYTWASGTGADVEVVAIQRRTELDARHFAMPPVGADPAPGEIPRAADRPFASALTLLGFRPDGAHPDRPRGLTLDNASSLLLYAVVDGVPTRLVEPHSSRELELPAGSYAVAFRTMLGDRPYPASTIEVPGRARAGPPLPEAPDEDVAR